MSQTTAIQAWNMRHHGWQTTGAINFAGLPSRRLMIWMETAWHNWNIRVAIGIKRDQWSYLLISCTKLLIYLIITLWFCNTKLCWNFQRHPKAFAITLYGRHSLVFHQETWHKSTGFSDWGLNVYWKEFVWDFWNIPKSWTKTSEILEAPDLNCRCFSRCICFEHFGALVSH